MSNTKGTSAIVPPSGGGAESGMGEILSPSPARFYRVVLLVIDLLFPILLLNLMVMSRNYKFHKPEAAYFVSFAVVEWTDVFTRNEYKKILEKVVKRIY